MLIFPHLHVRERDLVPGEHLTHTGVDALLQDEAIGLARLFQMRKVRALDTFLPHPDIARVEGKIVAGGAGAEHDHAAALDHHGRDREGRLAWMLEDEVDIVALAGDGRSLENLPIRATFNIDIFVQ